MPKHFLYNPIVLPNHVHGTQDVHVARENAYYRDNHDHEKIIRESNVRLSWRRGTIDMPAVDTQWGQAFHNLNVDLGARGNTYVGTFDSQNVQKITARRHTKWYKFGYKNGPLAIVGENDLLNINGHGNASGVALSYKVSYHNRWDYYCISHDTLADLLKADGLPRNHRYLRLAICFGGGVENEPMLVPSFAQKLAQALSNRGYTKIVIGGYTGATAGNNTVINLNPNGQTLNLVGGDRANHIQWYDHRGMPSAGPGWL